MHIKCAINAVPCFFFFKLYNKTDFPLFPGQNGQSNLRGKVSVFRTASQQNITVAILQETTHTCHIDALSQTIHMHTINAHSISHRWKLSFPSAEASGDVFTPANRAWSPFLLFSLVMCEHMECVCTHTCAGVCMRLLVNKAPGTTEKKRIRGQDGWSRKNKGGQRER